MLVSPPRDLPSRASSKRSLRRRRTRRGSSRSRLLHRPALSAPSHRPLLPGPLLLGGGFLQGVHDLLADAHPSGNVVAARGRGIHADQGVSQPSPWGKNPTPPIPSPGGSMPTRRTMLSPAKMVVWQAHPRRPQGLTECRRLNHRYEREPGNHLAFSDGQPYVAATSDSSN